MSKIVHVVGARPQFIKLAPLLKAFRERWPEAKVQVVHTGQHYDYEMSGVFFRDLGLPEPDVHLGVGSGTHAYQTGEMLKGLEAVFLRERLDMVVVYGDTNSTLAGALAAAKLHIPVAHVEAGLRSFNKRMPEEINRVLTDHVSDLLFAPTETAVENLAREGITEGVYLVGDVMYDAVLLYGRLAESTSRILEELSLTPKGYVLATVHRAENTDDPQRLEGIFYALVELAEKGLVVVLPLHPRTRKALARTRFAPFLSGGRPSGLRLIAPVSYLDMLMLEKNARLILTDSGGVQKEAFVFRVPCLTLREETEWVETLEEGRNRLVGAEPERIVREAEVALSLQDFGAWPSMGIYGGGRAAERIVQVMREYPRCGRC